MTLAPVPIADQTDGRAQARSRRPGLRGLALAVLLMLVPTGPQRAAESAVTPVQSVEASYGTAQPATAAPAQAPAAPAQTPAAPTDPQPDRAEPGAPRPRSFGRGLKFKPAAAYRSLERAAPNRAALPPAADLSQWFPPPKQQGDQSSCVGWSVGYGMRGYYANRAMGRTGTRDPVALSPSFVYNQILEPGDGCDSGSLISDALSLLRDVGTVPLSRFPYRDTECTRRPTPDVRREAAGFRIQAWRTVDTRNPGDIKGQIARGDPVVIGMVVNDAFTEVTGDTVFTDTGRDGEGHAMVVVGYDDARRAFRVMNSWGQAWGRGGFGWISYGSFRARVDEAYVATVANLPPVAVTPPPTHNNPHNPPPAPRPDTDADADPADRPPPRPNVVVAPPLWPPGPPTTTTTAAIPPGLSAKARRAFERYLAARDHKAFAVAADGSFGWQSGRNSATQARDDAVATCEKFADDVCRVVMVDNRPSDTAHPPDAPQTSDAAVPAGLSGRARQAYQQFLAATNHKAFAASRDGAFGWRSDRRSAAAASEEAVSACERHTENACRLIAVDDRPVQSSTPDPEAAPEAAADSDAESDSEDEE